MSIQGVPMIMAYDITSFSVAEPDFLEVLFRSAKVRRDTLVLRRDEWLARVTLYRNLNLLASISRKFAKLTTELQIGSIQQSGDLEEGYGHLSFLINVLSELIVILQEKGMDSETLFKRSFSAFVGANEELKSAQEKWAKALVDNPVDQTELDKLLKQITPENRHAFVDWGKPAGKEIW